MSEREFSKHQRTLEIHGRIDNSDDRESFYSNLMEIYDMVVQFDDDYWGDDAEFDEYFKNFTSLTPEVLQNIKHGVKIDGESASGEIDFMFDMLEGGDMNDSFGTEGWRHRLGWDE